MIGVDTNVVIRFLVDDEPKQHRKAVDWLTARTFEDPAFLSATSLAEVVWVLNRRLAYPMDAIVPLLRHLLASEGLVVEHAAELDQLIEGGTVPPTDLADYLIAWAGNAAGCSHTMTFDRKAAKHVPGMKLLA